MNLVDTLLSPLLEASRLDALAKTAGCSESELREDLSCLVPSFLGILTALFRGGGSGLVWQAVRQADEQLDADRFQILLDVGRVQYLRESGQLSLDSILGQDRWNAILGVLRQNTQGTRGDRALLLPLMAPYLLAALSRQLNSPPWSYNMNSLALLLESQRKHVTLAAPDDVFASLATLPGLDPLSLMRKNSSVPAEDGRIISPVSTFFVGALILGVVAVIVMGSSWVRPGGTAPQPPAPTTLNPGQGSR